MRHTSSESGGKIIKGSTSGRAAAFDIRSCFAFASIGVGIKQNADATWVDAIQMGAKASVPKTDEA